MRHFIIGLLVGCIGFACARGERSVKMPIERRVDQKLWRACENFETSEVIGKLCNRVCLKRDKKGNCAEVSKREKKKGIKTHWKTNVKNFCKSEGFEFYRKGKYRFVPENRVN